MGKSKLLQKSEENKKAAELLAKEKLYNAATSRLYYSVYQKVNHILDIKGIVEFPEDKPPHVARLIALKKHVIKRGKDRNNVSKIYDLKKKRVTSDYEEVNITENMYDDVKKISNEIEELLRNYH